jgi:thiol-disulfide isomerase/thioredoxin
MKGPDMRSASFLIFLFLLTGCGGNPATQMDSDPSVLTGRLERSDIDVWMKPMYDTLSLQTEFLPLISQAHQDVEVLVFLGTWCSDSKRDVPRFFRLADEAGISPKQITVYGLDQKKQSRDGMAARYGITAVPTFIFIKHQDEVGRIVEQPETTLEGDVLKILAIAAGR